MDDRVTITRRFSGPPDMGQGGYVGGLLARRLSVACAEARLHRPTPLEKPLDVDSADDGSVRFLEDGNVVAECRPAAFEVNIPPLVTPQAAADASYIPEPLRHDFAQVPEPDRCFGCGPKRDGLRLHAGTILPGRVVACPVSMPADLPIDGVVPLEVVWAALDCPSMWACWVLAQDAEREVLLSRGVTTGSLAVDVRRLPTADEDLFVQAWRVGREGRKVYGDAVLVSGTDDIVAVAHQTAIAL